MKRHKKIDTEKKKFIEQVPCGLRKKEENKKTTRNTDSRLYTHKEPCPALIKQRGGG
jgi:hypothetical protein